MTRNAHTTGHPSTADEAWHWLKCIGRVFYIELFCVLGVVVLDFKHMTKLFAMYVHAQVHVHTKMHIHLYMHIVYVPSLVIPWLVASQSRGAFLVESR